MRSVLHAVIDSDSKQYLQEAMRGQGSKLSLLLRQRIRKNGSKLLPIKSAVSRSPASRAVITQQAVRKKKAYFKDYVLTNLQALYRSSKVDFETRTPKKKVFLTFLTSLAL